MKVIISKGKYFDGTPYVPAAFKSEVKKAAADFREAYTENDLLRAFCDAVEEIRDEPELLDELGSYSAEVLRCDVEAFYNPGVVDFTSFRVEMWVDKSYCGKLFRVKFYTDRELKIDTHTMFDSRGLKMGRIYEIRQYETTRDTWRDDIEARRALLANA